MRKFTRAFPFFFFLVFFLFASSLAWAQSGGALKGTVIDQDGKFPVPTVRISVTGIKKFDSTIEDGTYVIENIPAGVYKVTFELAGYLTEIIKEVTISEGQTTELEAL